jgi:hypothetical protein
MDGTSGILGNMNPPRSYTPGREGSYFNDFRAPTQDFTSPVQKAELDRIGRELRMREMRDNYRDYRSPPSDTQFPELDQYPIAKEDYTRHPDMVGQPPAFSDTYNKRPQRHKKSIIDRLTWNNERPSSVGILGSLQ